MAPQVEVLDVKSHDLSVIPKIHKVGEPISSCLLTYTWQQ